jgi:hypothetical protein
MALVNSLNRPKRKGTIGAGNPVPECLKRLTSPFHDSSAA